MNIVMKMIRKSQRLVHHFWKTPFELNRLSQQDDKLARAIAEAIYAASAQSATAEERTWIDRIEAMRDQLNTSSEILEQMPDSNGVIKTFTVGEVCRVSSKQPSWTRLLFHLIRKIQPGCCIEMGTCLGVSASYLGAAGQLNEHGKIITLEGSPQRAEKARENLKSLGLEGVQVVVGLFQDTLENTLAEAAPIDFIFVDGHHDGEATINYFEQILPFLNTQAVLVFDDIVLSDDMLKAWKHISSDKRVHTVIDLFKIGICIVSSEPRSLPGSFHIALDNTIFGEPNRSNLGKK